MTALASALTLGLARTSSTPRALAILAPAPATPPLPAAKSISQPVRLRMAAPPRPILTVLVVNRMSYKLDSITGEHPDHRVTFDGHGDEVRHRLGECFDMPHGAWVRNDRIDAIMIAHVRDLFGLTVNKVEIQVRW